MRNPPAEVDPLNSRPLLSEVRDGIHLRALAGPSATWTYMMTDNPLGTPGDRAERALGRGWRRALDLE
jgi:preprotein translocase subunit SecA